MAFNPFTAALDAGTETMETWAETTRRSSMLPERSAEMATIDVGQTPSEIVYQENKLDLLHYESRTDEQNEMPILVVYALINRPYILDLQPDRSVIRKLLDAGHDVYMIDWNEPSRLDQHLTIDDYVNRYIDNCVDEVRERSGQDSINILGYCMGGTKSAMYAALYPEKVNALGLMAAGLCFDGTGGVLEQWGDDQYFDPEDLTDTFGNAPSDLLDDGFALMDPVNNYVSKYVTLFENVESDDFVANFARMEKWLGDGIDMAGDTYAEFLEKIYQNNELYNNELYLDGEHVDIDNIDMPVLQILGEYDHLIPPEASKPFMDVIPSEDKEIIEYPTGHIGLSVSSSSHENVWSRVCEWYWEKSEPATDDETVDTEAAEADVENIQAQAAEAAADAAGDDAADAEDAVAGEDSEADVETVNGIGPTFAERLREAGIETVGDLAGYDGAELAEIAETSESRAQDWLDAL